MNEQVSKYFEKYSPEIVDLLNNVRGIVFESTSTEPKETVWAGMPSYYVGDAFVRLIAFGNHINVEAKAIEKHREELASYKITPKGMLQIYLGQPIPKDALKQIFAETFAAK